MRRLWWLVPLGLALPWLPGVPAYWVTLANSIGIAAIVTIGLVVLTGVAGMTSFGAASFCGFGAYTTAVLTTQHAISPWLALPAALLVAGLAALAIAAVTLRLSGHYLALGTIAWSVALYYLFANLDLVGRNDGISAIPPLSLLGWRLTDGRAYFAVVWLGVLAAAGLTANLLDSRVGRCLRALNGAGAAAASCGVATRGMRTLAFVHAALLAAFAGWLYAHMQRSVNPSPFGLNAGIEYLLMAVVGGAAHIGGAILGAALVVLSRDMLQDWLPGLLGQTGDFEAVAFGLLLVAVLQAAPDGLYPLLVRGTGTTPRRLPTPARLPARRLTPGETVLEVAGLAKSFGGLAAVRDLSLSVRAGEIVGVIGPNGAGKSTLFNVLTGVLGGAAGRVAFRGVPILGRAARAVAGLGIGRTFQHVRLVGALSVRDNAALGAHLRGRAGALSAMLRLDRAEEAAIAGEALAQLRRVGLDHLADRPAASLALGQQRLLEVARCLCLDPVLLMLDEPAAGLRHAEKQALAGLLGRLRADGVAILLVEHDMGFVMGLADRLVVMNFGTRLAEGAPASVRADPAVVAAYLGAEIETPS